MKILVTGAAGFIGFHITKRLINQGDIVIGIDNLNNYYDPNLKKERIKELKKISNDKNFKFIKADITNSKKIEQIFEDNRFDKVCHLAAQAGVRYSFENPDCYINSNIIGFYNILQMCLKHNIKHLIYASSSSVYGNNSKIPFKEEDKVDSPESLYAATKKSNELLAYFYTSQYKLNTTGLRFFTVYGPWGRPDMAPFIFMDKILHDKEIEVYNKGELSRDFSYIDDIVEGVVKIINGPNKSPNLIYNIGNCKPVKLLDFITTIERITGRKAKKRMVGMQKGDVYTTYADCSKLKKDYNFSPNTHISRGLEEFYVWFKKYYNIEN